MRRDDTPVGPLETYWPFIIRDYVAEIITDNKTIESREY